jgi:ribokinase
LYAVIPNKTEAEMLSGIKVSDLETAKQAADIIAAKGVDKVVITLGSKGALIKDGDVYSFIPADKVEAVDTTAAGDTFCGAFCVGISEGLSIEDAVKMATKAAGITVTREGAQAAIPYRKEIQL